MFCDYCRVCISVSYIMEYNRTKNKSLTTEQPSLLVSRSQAILCSLSKINPLITAPAAGAIWWRRLPTCPQRTGNARTPNSPVCRCDASYPVFMLPHSTTKRVSRPVKRPIYSNIRTFPGFSVPHSHRCSTCPSAGRCDGQSFALKISGESSFLDVTQRHATVDPFWSANMVPTHSAGWVYPCVLDVVVSTPQPECCPSACTSIVALCAPSVAPLKNWTSPERRLAHPRQHARCFR